MGSSINISDNSGASRGKLIKVLGSTPLKKGHVGDIVILTITKVKTLKKVFTHQVRKGLIIGTVSPIVKSSGVTVSFSTNNLVLLDDRNNPIGNRINHFTISNLRFKNYMKIVSISFGLL